MLDELLTQLDDTISAIQREIADVRAESVDRDDAGAWVRGLERARERLTQTSLSWLADFDARSAHACDGHRSPATWLVANTGTRRLVAGSQTYLARRLLQMPVTDAAFANGEITEAHCRVLLRADNPRTRDAFTEQETLLVSHARSMTADELARYIEWWLEVHDPDGAEPHREDVDRLHYSETLDGRLKGDFDLGGELAVTAKAVLDAKVKQLAVRDKKLREVDPTDPLADERHSERAARAMVELLEAGASVPGTAAARRPLLTVHTTMATLAGVASPEHSLLDVDEVWQLPVSLATLQRWACDSHVARAVIGPDAEILDLGRAERTATVAQRRALASRDRGCAVPGCDRPVGWTDAHHVDWWETGGPTDIDNLVLLCRHHHTRVHAKELTVLMDDGVPVFVLPAGRVLVPPDHPPDHPPDGPPHQSTGDHDDSRPGHGLAA